MMPITKALAIMSDAKEGNAHWLTLERRYATPEECAEAAKVKREAVIKLLNMNK